MDLVVLYTLGGMERVAGSQSKGCIRSGGSSRLRTVHPLTTYQTYEIAV